MFGKKKRTDTSGKTERRRNIRKLTGKDEILILVKGVLLAAAVGILFYDSIWAVFAGCCLLPFYYRFSLKKLVRKGKEELAYHFKEALLSMLAALKAGYSVENSFVEAHRDMECRFGSKNEVTMQLLYICRQLRNNIPIEKLVDCFAKETDVDDIRDFAGVFRVAKRSGGDMAKIMERSIGIIGRRMEVKEDIRILVASKKYEQQIMNLVPMGIIAYIRFGNPGYFDPIYHNLGGVVIMTAVLTVYILAYVLAEKILEIA